MIQVIDRSKEHYMEVIVDEPDFKDHFAISSEIYFAAYVMDGGDNLRRLCIARRDFFEANPAEKAESDSLWVLSHKK